jgi:hypothetical protein
MKSNSPTSLDLEPHVALALKPISELSTFITGCWGSDRVRWHVAVSWCPK